MTSDDANGTIRCAIALVGRVLMSAIFIWGGYGKLMAAGGTIGFFASLGLPMPGLAYVVAVVVELGGGILILLGLFTRPTGLVLALWCIATALVAHANFGDSDMQNHFLKNLAMAGGFAYVAAWGAGSFSLDAGLFGGRPAS